MSGFRGRGVLEISDIHTKSFYFSWELSDMKGGGSEKCQKSPDVINGRPLKGLALFICLTVRKESSSNYY
jgi:hypothetical protein